MGTRWGDGVSDRQDGVPDGGMGCQIGRMGYQKRGGVPDREDGVQERGMRYQIGDGVPDRAPCPHLALALIWSHPLPLAPSCLAHPPSPPPSVFPPSLAPNLAGMRVPPMFIPDFFSIAPHMV